MSDHPRRTFGDWLSSCIRSPATRPLLATLCGILVFWSVIEFFIQVKAGFRILEFDDEMGVLVAARMVIHGRQLYKDIFDSHGPLPIVIAHLYASTVSESDFSYVRLAQVILVVLSCVAVSLSASLKNVLTRVWAGTLYLLLLSCFWTTESYNLLWYDTMGRFFFVIIIAQLIVPLLVCEEPSIYGSFGSGLA